MLQHTEATFDWLPSGAEAARTYGLLCALVLAAGQMPRRRVADLMIASIAAINRLPLYTTNPGDFAGLERLVTVVAGPRPARG